MRHLRSLADPHARCAPAGGQPWLPAGGVRASYGAGRHRVAVYIPAMSASDRSARSQSTRALLRLRQLLLDGEFPPGTRMAELPLVERLGVSRTPLRDALSALAYEGLLELLPGGGYTVRSFTQADIADAIELRGVLEGTIAHKAAERRLEPAAIAPLHAINDELDARDHAGASSGFATFERYLGAQRAVPRRAAAAGGLAGRRADAGAGDDAAVRVKESIAHRATRAASNAACPARSAPAGSAGWPCSPSVSESTEIAAPMSDHSTSPMCPKRRIRPVHLPCPPAIDQSLGPERGVERRPLDACRKPRGGDRRRSMSHRGNEAKARRLEAGLRAARDRLVPRPRAGAPSGESRRRPTRRPRSTLTAGVHGVWPFAAQLRACSKSQ